MTRARPARAAKLFYRASGSGDAVLLLHAGLGDSRMWSDVVAHLVRRYRVVSPDFQGYGRSELRNRTVSHVRNLEVLLADLHVNRAFVVGVSLGARVAAEFAALAPERVAGLVLVSPVFSNMRWSRRTRMYTHGVGRVTLDLVAGLIEDGEEPLLAAQRELREETSYESGDWSTLGSYVVNSNYGCGRMHAFVARDARQVTQPSGGDLEEMELVLRPFAMAAQDLRAGCFELLSAAAALALAIVHVEAGE